ncbi:TIGR03943 family protein [Collibacillus ludicampi]|uniref:TIGR03943 family protein n=1 Tax=Collibacillus ludicampi TaxID=2771369 RepID=A0AAV4LBR2_9BACL|nr:TIGR03943 family protein [Collibacillus ludicampi]GIM45144.1 TIGR03943 family protein [Collibacillus ludicampi]
MKSQRLDSGRLLQALILFGFSIYLIKLFETGEIHRLVAPHIAVLLKLTLGVLIVMTLYALFSFFTNRSACECAHDHDHHHGHTMSPGIVSLLLVVPVALGLLVPTQALGASTMNNGLQALSKESANGSVIKQEKSTDTLSSTSHDENNDKVDLSKVPRADMKGIPKPPKPKEGAELSLLDVEANILIAPEYYFNRRFKFTGFVYHPEGWPANRMILCRYLITCCAADATPIGITVETNDASKYKNNSWVEIDGTISTRKIPEADKIAATSWYYGYPNKPVLIGHAIHPIQEPADPYMYPVTMDITGGN